MSEFTEMMRAVQAGDRESAEKMLPRVYDELRKLALALSVEVENILPNEHVR